MSKQKSIDHSTKRSFHLIFQVGNSAFLRLPPFFPVVGSVEVSGNFIDRLIKAPRGQNQTLKVQGGSAPFFRNSPSGWPGSFLQRFFRAKIRLPPLTLSPLNTLPAGKKKYLTIYLPEKPLTDHTARSEFCCAKPWFFYEHL